MRWTQWWPLALALAMASVAPRVWGDEAYRASVEKWRGEREARLRADGGWLSVAGLTWLKPGANSFGTGTGSAIVLPEGSAPANAGVFELVNGETTVKPAQGVTPRRSPAPRREHNARCRQT